MSLAASLLVLCATTVSVDMLQFQRDKTHSPDGLASYDLPNGWSPRDYIREPTHALIPYKKTQSWWFGAGDPLEVYAWVVIMTPNADETVMRKALAEGHSRVLGDTKEFPAVGSIKDGDRETWVSEGSYQIHSNHDPEKIIIVRSLDRVRRVAFVARVYERKIKHEALLKITRTFFSTLKLTQKRDSYFGQVGDWKAVRAERNQKEFAFINEFLAKRKLPPAVLDSTVMHDGWVYTLFDNSFFLGRILGPRRLDDALYKARGELTWLIYRGREWDSWVPSNRTRPRGKSRYYDGDYAPIAWAKGMGHELDRSLAHFFTVRRCWLTGDEWEEPRDMTKCGLDAWFDDALEFEKAFKANEIKIG